jgi:hypothetical protein
LAADGFALAGTQFVGNNTDLFGAAIFHGRGDGCLVNALFAHNTALHGSLTLFLAPADNVTILHTTFANSAAGAGGAICVIGGTASIANTIIASYTTAIQVTNGAVTSDYNLFFNAPTRIITGSHSLKGTNPLFANPLANNFHLSFGSPAAGAGFDAGVTTDLDGHPRPPPSKAPATPMSGRCTGPSCRW